jgi:HEAT repeat protein
MFPLPYDPRIPSSRVDVKTSPPQKIGSLRNSEIYTFLSQLSPDTPWGDRQHAAQRLGYMRSKKAVPSLIAALANEPFWMVRYTIVQALEKIGASVSVPTLSIIAETDDFQVVRSTASKAVARIKARTRIETKAS